MPGTQHHAAFSGQIGGVVAFGVILLVFVIRCLFSARHPRANAACTIALAIIISTILMACAAQLTHNKLVQGLIGLVIVAGLVTAIVLAIIGLVDISSKPG